MDMKGALRARLIASAPVADLVATYTPQGGSPTKAIFWLTRPQGSVLPAITLQTISGDRPQTYDGLQAWRETRVQFDAWAATFAEAQAVLDAAVPVLAPRAKVAGVRFDGIGFEGERDGADTLDGKMIYRAGIDLLVRHSAAA